MNKDTIVGFILIAVILVGYSIWMTPRKKKWSNAVVKLTPFQLSEQQQRVLDSVRMAAEIKRVQQELEQGPDKVEATIDQQTSESGIGYQQLRDRFGLLQVLQKVRNGLFTWKMT